MKKVLFLAISTIISLVLAYKFLVPTSIKNRIRLKVYCTFLDYENLPVTINNERKLIKIPENSTVESILNILNKYDIIKNEDKDTFYCTLQKQKAIPNLKAGYFIISPQLPFAELAQKLQNPETSIVIITVPEGLRWDQISYILAKNLQGDFSKFNKKEFDNLVNKPQLFRSKYSFLPKNLKNLEGFLFPDTYEFNKYEITAKDIINIMLTNFQQKALPIIKQLSPYDKALNLDIYDKLIIASIIERETNKEMKERQMVADVIYKRLINNMPLQIDATLLYPKRDWTYKLTYDDLHNDNPYNTYTRYGLPPTPICNPGISAITAVVKPIKNSYYYYMHDSNGNIHFSRTFNEHLYNVNTYLK